MAGPLHNARDLLEAGVAGADCGRLEEAVRKSKVLLGARHGLVVDAEAVLEAWRRQCGPARTALVEAVAARVDLKQLVGCIEAVEAHPNRRLMRSDLRRAKNLVVETEEAMSAIKPCLATQDAHAVEAFLRKYQHVLPSDVYSEVAFLRDEFARGGGASPAPLPRSGAASPRPSGDALPETAISHPHYSPPRVHANSLSGKVFAPLAPNTLHGASPAAKPRPPAAASPAPQPWPASGGGAGVGGGRYRASASPGPPRPYTSPHPPATPDAEYMPAGMFESGQRSPGTGGSGTHPHYRRHGSAAAAPRSSPAAAAPPPAPFAATATPRSALRSHTTAPSSAGYAMPTPPRGLPPRTPSASATPSVHRTATPGGRSQAASLAASPQGEDARHTERLRLYLHEINAREKLLREERRECQAILKDMVGDLSATKPLRLPVTPVAVKDGVATPLPAAAAGALPPLGGVDARDVFNVVQPKNFPEEDLQIQQAMLGLQLEREREERVRARQATETICLLEQEQALEYQTMAQYESEAWFNVLRLYKLSEAQVRVVQKARAELHAIERKARALLEDEQDVGFADLQNRCGVERSRVAVAYDRLSQLQREDARVKSMEAKLGYRVAAGGAIPDDAPSPALVIPDPRMRETEQLLAEMQRRAAAAEAQNAALQTSLQSLQKEMGVLKTAHEAAMATSSTSLALAGDVSAQWEEEKAAYEAKMAALAAEVAGLKPAEAALAALQQRMAEDRAALVRELSEEKAGLQEQLAKITSSQAAKQAETAQQREEMDSLTKAKAKKDDELKAMKEEAAANLRRLRLLEDERATQQQRTATFEEEKAELLQQLKQAREELVKFQTGQRELPSLKLFIRGASEMLMDEQRGRYALWEEEFRSRSSQEVNTYRLLKTIHKTIQLTQVDEPAARGAIEHEEGRQMAALEQSPEIMELFALLEETVSSCVDDDIETIASSVAEDF